MARVINRRRAFTLVELLVVIGIIALLVALLMPALRKARQQAITVACQSQLRQIGITVNIYTNDNRGWIPHPGWNGWFPLRPPPFGGSNPQRNMSFAERLVMARASTQVVTNWETHYPVSGRGLYRCPGYGEGSYEGGQVGPEYNGYGLNYRAAFSSGTTLGAGSANPAIEHWMKIQRMRKEKILMADGFRYIQSNPASSQFGVYWKRHNLGANYLFPDWHVEWNRDYHKENAGDPAKHWFIPLQNAGRVYSDHL